MLSLVATPIGNLADITQRAIEVLSNCDAVLAEDTRRSLHLLKHLGIEKKLIPYHKFNEQSSLNKILEELKNGKHFALVSDAGTPCINDPGFGLVQACIKEKIPFTSIPGPCSVIQALLLSGMSTEKFQFIGFLPKKGSGILKAAFSYPGTTIAFESPERLIATLKTAIEIDPHRKIAVAREMTKVFEECCRGTALELLEHFTKKIPQGEVVLVIEEGQLPTDLSLEELISMLQDLHGLSLKEAIKTAAHLTKTPKSEVYKKVHSSSKN